MGLSDELARASDIMIRRGIPVEEQQQITEILVNAGINHVLDEQEKLRQYNEGVIHRVFSGGIVH